MKTINAEELKKKIDQGEDMLLVNVLSSQDFEKKHIPNSINIPVKSEDFIKKFENKVSSKDKTIVVYCASLDCPASPTAAKKLEEAGFTNVIDYEKGIKGWEEKGYPVKSNSHIS